MYRHQYKNDVPLHKALIKKTQKPIKQAKIFSNS